MTGGPISTFTSSSSIEVSYGEQVEPSVIMADGSATSEVKSYSVPYHFIIPILLLQPRTVATEHSIFSIRRLRRTTRCDVAAGRQPSSKILQQFPLIRNESSGMRGADLRRHS